MGLFLLLFLFKRQKNLLEAALKFLLASHWMQLHLGPSSMPGIFVCLGCHKKGPQTDQLKQQKFIFSEFWRLDVQGQSVGRVSSEASALGLPMAASPCVLTPSMHVYVLIA